MYGLNIEGKRYPISPPHHRMGGEGLGGILSPMWLAKAWNEPPPPSPLAATGGGGTLVLQEEGTPLRPCAPHARCDSAKRAAYTGSVAR
jgi:hypothetical protein